MNAFHRFVAVAVAGCAIAATACLPLPPALEDVLCGVSLTPPPTPDDLAVLDRLVGRGLQVAITSPPSVWLDAHDGAIAAALRAEFGSAIDIEIGRKRLGRVPGNPDACLLAVPTWAIAERAPAGVSVTVTPTQRSFDRTGDVTANLRVTNRTGRSILVAPTLPKTCTADRGAALSSTDSALAVNDVDGQPPLDPLFQLIQRARAYGTLQRADDGTLSISKTVAPCAARSVLPITVRPGASTTIPVTARTVSVQATADPLVLPGRYHLRAAVDLWLSTKPSELKHTVAAPPTAIELR